jgi:hypothetical protein
MINLLPEEKKADLRAARTNTVLLRYNIILIAAVLFLAGAVAVVYVFLTTIKATAEQSIQDNIVKEQAYENVKQESVIFKNSLSDAKTMLGDEVSYSRALIRYARLFPEGTAIDSMQFDATSFSTPLNVSVKITGQQAAQALIDSMNSSPYVTGFTRKAITINQNSTYPYTMEVTFTLNKEIAL